MNTQFDLEQRIMQCWDIIDDIDMLYTNVLDAPEKLTEDQIANTLLGMKRRLLIAIFPGVMAAAAPMTASAKIPAAKPKTVLMHDITVVFLPRKRDRKCTG